MNKKLAIISTSVIGGTGASAAAAATLSSNASSDDNFPDQTSQTKLPTLP